MKKQSLLLTFSLLLLTSAAQTVNLPAGYTPLEYIESTADGGQYIDTGYAPTLNTRLEATFIAHAKSRDWGVLFGVTGNDSSKDGILLRHYKYENGALSAWFCNDADIKTPWLVEEWVSVELKAGSLKFTTEAGIWESSFKTTGTPCREPIYIFCGNNGGKAWRHQAMRLYSFKIY